MNKNKSLSNSIMRSSRFLPLFITQFSGAFNDNAFKNAFLIWFTFKIAEETGQKPELMTGIAAALFMLPFFLFSATAGQLADKYDKAKLTQKFKLVEIVLMVLCIFFFYFKSVSGLLIILFFMGTQSTFFGPIKYSLLPEHLHEDELIKGNGLIEGGTFIAILLGTIIGGLMINTENGLIYIAALLISFSTLGYISSIYIPSSKTFDNTLKISWNIIKETKTIIVYATKIKIVYVAIMAISWFWLVGAMFLTEFPPFTKNVIHGNENIVTLFLTLFSIGIAIGSLMCNLLLKGKIHTRYVPISAAMISLSIFIFCLCSYYYQLELLSKYPENLNGLPLLTVVQFFNFTIYSYGIVLSLLLMSVASGIFIVPLYSVMQHFSEQAYVARIIAANNVLNALFMVLSSLIAILLISIGCSIIQLLLITGILNLFIYIYMVKSRCLKIEH